MADFMITAERSQEWDDAEVRRRLGRAYSLILSYEGQGGRKQAHDTADRDEFGDRTRTAADDAPTSQPVTQETL